MEGWTYIFNDGAGFPKGDTGVRIFNGGDSTIDTDLLVGIFLELGEVKEFRLVWDLQLLEDDCDFPWIRASRVAIEGDWFAHDCDLDQIVRMLRRFKF